MNRELEKLLAGKPPSTTKIDKWIRRTTFPLIDGDSVTFVFRGAADAVYVRCWISGLDTAQPFESLEGTDLWAATMQLPKGSRIEYKLDVSRSGQNELILDPLNPVTARDPFGANSVCRGAGYKRPAWSLYSEESRKGSLHVNRINSEAFGEEREFQVYLPATFRENRRYPLLIVHDGIDYLRYADFKNVLDNLTHKLEIPPMVVALIQSPDRIREYAGYSPHATFVAKELLPFLTEQYPLLPEVESRCVMGASFGGVASLHVAWQYPDLFGSLLLQSGSFAFSDIGRHRRGEVFDPVVAFVNAFREDATRPVRRVYMSCGVYESLIYENRSMVPHLQSKNVDVRFEEARDAHNWENWRDRLRTGLSWIMPGPGWMVYE
ncbi:MAG: alpha/beta hydrolase-fold protein [Pseudomonadota bacterium]